MPSPVARWESKSGKWWADLYAFDNGGYFYRGVGCGGNMSGTATLDEAIAAMEQKCVRGYFQPDANTTPMRRVI
jgi:hypothetical protein